MSNMFYEKAINKIGKEKGNNAFFINIGAMDGVTFDESAQFMKNYEFKSLYVEPIPHVFKKLQENITGSNVIFENSAISTYDGMVQMIFIETKPIEIDLIHSCFYGMSSIYPPKNGLKDKQNEELVSKYGLFTMVPCITLESLLKKHNIEQFDILSIDTEGHDWKILSQLDFSKYRPSAIRIEIVNLTESERDEVCKFLSNNNYIFEISGQNLDAIPMEIYEEFHEEIEAIKKIEEEKRNVTIVTGLWDLGRGNLSEDFKRSYDNYKEKFAELLKAPVNMVIYVGREDVDFVWQHRSKENTYVKVMELEEFKTWFQFYDKIQEIRNNPEWYEQADWLKTSPQAKLEYYNPLVMSKLFLLNNASILDPFRSEYFYWIDAGITNTVHPGYFYHDLVFNNLPEYSKYIDSFLFLSYPYIGAEEIHGFRRKQIAQYCGTNYVKYVCRGGFFGGHKERLNEINGIYYHLLSRTLEENLMGTEESIFTIISHQYPELVHRFELSDNGMVWPFFEELKDVKQFISKSSELSLDFKTAKNILYILTFNSPSQFKSVAESIKLMDPTMFNKSRKVLINNSIDESLFEEYDKLCVEYGFEEIHRENLGVCGGRQFAAEHFDQSDAHFYMFFEDDMHLADPKKIGPYCRNGFSTDSTNLYDKVLKIMLKENFDFLKFSFSEFFGDNSVQWAWYNVPQNIRTEYWPHYDTLPTSGLDRNAPKTKFNTIDFVDGIPYISGDVYYSNWPQIVSRSGNKKMFLDTKWEYPYEQTWMSHIFQLIKSGLVTAGILLISPIEHNRFQFYEAKDRKEN